MMKERKACYKILKLETLKNCNSTVNGKVTRKKKLTPNSKTTKYLTIYALADR